MLTVGSGKPLKKPVCSANGDKKTYKFSSCANEKLSCITEKIYLPLFLDFCDEVNRRRVHEKALPFPISIFSGAEKEEMIITR